MKRLVLSFILGLICFGASAKISKDTTSYYRKAFEELQLMLTGEVPLSIKRAVFITENAYLENSLQYEDFTNHIAFLTSLTHSLVAEDNLIYNKSDRGQVLKSSAIYRMLKDSLTFVLPLKDSSSHSLKKNPYTYDMDDFFGEDDWTKMFVTKLLVSNSGNCHSLPLLYKILAEEVGVLAYLSIAPNHTYIKQSNKKDGWYNTELTTGRFPYDKDIKWNSYIKTEAVAKGVYMDTLSNQQTIAFILTDLAQGYVKKYGYNDLTSPINWLDVALEYYPNFANGLILRAELKKKQFQMLMALAEVKTPDALTKNSLFKAVYSEIEKSYFEIYKLGYRRMPKEMYLNWLFKVRNDTSREEYHYAIQQPFEEYGYDVFVATAGDGRNYEFYDQDTIARIGTVEINRLTGEIVRFVEYDLSEEIPDEVISRMYDPALGRFWQIDPLADHYHDLTPYNYVANNPIRNIDPDGRKIYDMTKNKAHKSALARFARTEQGQQFLAQYAKAGDVIGGVKFTRDGKYSHQNVAFYSRNMRNYGETRSFLRTKQTPAGLPLGDVEASTVRENLGGLDKLAFSVDIKNGLSEDQALETIGHESFIHVEKTTKDVEQGIADLKGGDFGSTESLFGNFLSFMKGLVGDDSDHKLAVDGKVATMEEFVDALDGVTGGSKFRDMYNTWKEAERKRQGDK